MKGDPRTTDHHPYVTGTQGRRRRDGVVRQFLLVFAALCLLFYSARFDRFLFRLFLADLFVVFSLVEYLYLRPLLTSAQLPDSILTTLLKRRISDLRLRVQTRVEDRLLKTVRSEALGLRPEIGVKTMYA